MVGKGRIVTCKRQSARAALLRDGAVRLRVKQLWRRGPAAGGLCGARVMGAAPMEVRG